MADINGNTLLMDWYNTYVAPKKEPIEGVFSRKSPDLGLGLPTSPTPVPSAPAVAIPPTMPETPANPVDSYTPQPISEPTTEAAPTAPATKDSGGISPGAMGLLGFGLSMAATPPRAVPYTGAEIVGNAGLHGLAFYEKALEDKRKQQALDVSTEEHKLTREDQRIYRQAQVENMQSQRRLEEQRITDLGLLREDKRKELEALTANAKALDEQVPPEILDRAGLKDFSGKMTYRQMKEAQSVLNAANKPRATSWRQVDVGGKAQWMDLNDPGYQDAIRAGEVKPYNKPGYSYQVDDKGNVTEIEHGKGVTNVIPKAGKTKPPTGSSGRAPSTFDKQWETAKKSWSEKPENVGKEPTQDQIAQEKRRLFPTAADMKAQKGAGSVRAGLNKAAKKVKMPNGEVWEFDAAGNRIK